MGDVHIYHIYSFNTEEYYTHPRKAAVQIAAAITAHARIHIHILADLIITIQTLTQLYLVNHYQMK